MASTRRAKKVARDFGAIHMNVNAKGAAAARNAGLKAATGEFIAFLDDDDVWLPSNVRQHLEIFDERPEHRGRARPGDRRRQRSARTRRAVAGARPTEPDALVKAMLSGYYPQLGATMVRASIRDEVGLFDVSLLGRPGLGLAAAPRAAPQDHLSQSSLRPLPPAPAGILRHAAPPSPRLCAQGLPAPRPAGMACLEIAARLAATLSRCCVAVLRVFCRRRSRTSGGWRRARRGLPCDLGRIPCTSIASGNACRRAKAASQSTAQNAPVASACDASVALTPAMALIDVLIPAYNAAATLREAVESVRAQTVADIRIVVVNDGSTDDTSAILSDLSRQDGRIHVVSKSNDGIVEARNDGLRNCTSEFIACLDADDIASPDRLERQLAYMHAHPECVALGGKVEHIDDLGAPLVGLPQPGKPSAGRRHCSPSSRAVHRSLFSSGASRRCRCCRWLSPRAEFRGQRPVLAPRRAWCTRHLAR